MTKALLLPFYSDGYDEKRIRTQIGEAVDYFESLGIEIECADAIKTVKQAEEAEIRYNPAAYSMVVLFPVSWASPTLAVYAARQFPGKPAIVYSISEFPVDGHRMEMSSAPAAAAMKGVMGELGMSCAFISRGPGNDEEKTADEIRNFAASASAVFRLSHTRIGCFGTYFNGISSADMDVSTVRRLFKVELFSFDDSELLREMDSVTVDAPVYQEALAMVTSKTSGCPDKYLDTVVRMTAALLSYVREYDLTAINVRCHSELCESYGVSACLALSVLGDVVTTSCEADVPVCLTQVLLNALTDSAAPYIDVRAYDKEGITVASCGYAPCSMCSDSPVMVCSEADGFLTNMSCFKSGSVTLARLIKDGLSMKLHTVTGNAVGAVEPLREMGCPLYPMTRIVLDTSVRDFRDKVGGNHYAFVYGDASEKLGLACRMLGFPVM